MGESKIEWTDATWNPVRGCTKVSPGCAHCYAETFAERFRGVKGHAYEQGFDLRLVPEKLDEPLTWKKPRRVFVNSMSDLFQDGVSETFILRAFTVMEKCPQHTFQILTKRAERMRDVVSWVGRKFVDNGDPWPMPNVWLGVSVENQHFADERIPLLLQTEAAIRFISAEPLLGPVNLRSVGTTTCPDCRDALGVYAHGKPAPRLDWVIVGGESGNQARPFDIAWARSIIKQCADAEVACFVKQIGAKPYTFDDMRAFPSGDKKGGDPAEWPADLRVRQFPVVGHVASLS